jgi:hypothetical protein
MNAAAELTDEDLLEIASMCGCKRMAPQVGLEPTTLRLTAGCSAIELLRSESTPGCVLDLSTKSYQRPQGIGNSPFLDPRPSAAWRRFGLSLDYFLGSVPHLLVAGFVSLRESQFC